MKNCGSTPISINLVGDHPNIYTKYKANPCNGLREKIEKV